MAEFIARLIDPRPFPSSVFTADKFYGWKIIPNIKHRLKTEVGSFVSRSNSKGLREDREYDYIKPKNTFRILILGDSFAEATNIPMQYAFHSQLEEFLNKSGSKLRYEVINSGVSGYSTDNEYLFFKHEGYKYHPDLVILTFLTQNDVRDNSQELMLDYFGYINKPYFVIENKKLKLMNFPYERRILTKSNSLIEKFKEFIKTKSRLYIFIGDRIKNNFRVAQFLIRLKLIRKQELKSDNEIIPSFYYIYAPVYPKKWLDAWEITEKIILELKKVVELSGGKLVVVIATNPEQVHASMREYWVSKFPVIKDKPLDLGKPQRVLVDFCKSNRIAVLDLLPFFLEDVRKNHRYLHMPKEKGHWSIAGHRLASDLIFGFLNENGFLPNR